LVSLISDQISQQSSKKEKRKRGHASPDLWNRDQRSNQLIEAHARLLMYHLPLDMDPRATAQERFVDLKVDQLQLETSVYVPFLFFLYFDRR
jgi:hypothetical protein